MKIGVFQDIHANLLALEKAVEVCRAHQCAKIYHVGDLIGLGPYPKETFELANSIEEMEFIMSEGYTGYKAFGGRETEAEHTNYYKNYIKRYFGSLMTKVKIDDKDLQLILLLNTPHQYLTFQGFPKGKNIFTSNYNDFYFPVNQNSVFFEFKNPDKHFNQYNKLMKDGVITNSKSQFDNMGQYAATPDFLLYHNNNMPWFKSYEVYLNDKLIPVNEDGIFEVSLKEGVNIIKSFAINQNGKKGSPTTLKIVYGI